MAFFGLGKKERVVDLSERYKRKLENKEMSKSLTEQKSKESTPTGIFPFFNASPKNEPYQEQSESSSPNSDEERRKKLAKRILDMTTKIEDLSNQIYHLQQRIEVLEKKSSGRN